MEENLFIASNQDIVCKVIRINVKFNLFREEGGPQKKNKHFFYYIRSKEKLYYAQIKSIKNIEFINKNYECVSNFKLILEFKNGFFLVEFKSPIVEEHLSILKDVYAKCNSKMIGDRTFSIYNTRKLSGFPYSLPVVDTATFKVDDKFRDILLYDNDIIPSNSEKRKTFAKIVNEDNNFFLTLTNENMIEVDYQYLLGDQHRETYRPYFYEFFLSEYSQEIIKTELKNQNYSEELLYEIEIISIRDIENRTNEGVLEGELLFSASPIKQIQTYIKILHTKIDKSIESQWNEISRNLDSKTYPIKDKFQIQQAFMNKIPFSNSSIINYNVKIFNVGQGNWIHILVYDNIDLIAKVIFDIGIGTKKGKHSNANLRARITKKAAEEIKENDMFVLSHWDLDHIQGVVELKRNQFYTSWIVPDLPRNPSNGAKRLAAFLKTDLKIISVFVDHSLNGSTIFENSYFRLGKGNGNGPGKNTSYTTENNSGLVLAIKKAGKKMLFPGDCEYSEFPSSFLNQNYEALVVSHHGAEIKQSQLHLIKCQTNNFAAVCVGEDSNYPKLSHIESVLTLGSQLNETRAFKDVHNPCQYKLI